MTSSKNLRRAMWTAQILLAVLFLFAGVSKLVMSAEAMQGPVALPLAFVRFIGVAETLGALGLVLPGVFGVRTSLTPLAAAGLTIIMVGATAVSAVGFGAAGAIFPLVVGLVAAAVAYGRHRVAPLRDRSAGPVLQTA